MGTVGEMKPIERPDDPKPRPVSSKPLVPDLTPRPEPPGTKIAGPPFYGRPWFAYLMGAVITAGGILTTIPATKIIGVGITVLCGGYIAWAGVDSKSSKKTWIDMILEAIRAALEALEKWVKKHK